MHVAERRPYKRLVTPFYKRSGWLEAKYAMDLKQQDTVNVKFSKGAADCRVLKILN